jgi:hypothetical protein
VVRLDLYLQIRRGALKRETPGPGIADACGGMVQNGRRMPNRVPNGMKIENVTKLQPQGILGRSTNAVNPAEYPSGERNLSKDEVRFIMLV